MAPVDTTKLRFLYIDDDNPSRQVLEILIKDIMGCLEIVTLEDSANLIERIEALPGAPDVVLIDIRIRPYDGYEILAMLRAHPRYKRVVAVAVTANVMADEVERLKQAGFDGLIGKPIIKENFPCLIEKLLLGEPVWYVP